MNNNSLNPFSSPKTSGTELAAACGLYCGACGVYLATQENDHDRILHYALILNQSFEETLCDGCGAERKSAHCRKMCTFIGCRQQRGLNSCAECPEFPCRELLSFRSKMPHRTEIIESLQRMKAVGTENWLVEMEEAHACPHCQTANSAYHLACRHCGFTPSCSFVSRHLDQIESYLMK